MNVSTEQEVSRTTQVLAPGSSARDVTVDQGNKTYIGCTFKQGSDPEPDEMVAAVSSGGSSSAAGSPAVPPEDATIEFIPETKAIEASRLGCEKAFVYLNNLISTDAKMGMIAGPSGVGKTHLLKVWLAKFAKERDYEIIVLDALGDLKVQVEQYAQSKGIYARPSKSTVNKLRLRLWDCIGHFSKKSKKVILFFDGYDAESSFIREFFHPEASRTKHLFTIATTCSTAVTEAFKTVGGNLYEKENWGEQDVVNYAKFLFGDQLDESFVRLIYHSLGGLPVIIDSVLRSLNGRKKSYINILYAELTSINRHSINQQYKVDQQILLLADRVWLEGLSEDAQTVLAILSIVDPSSIEFEQLEAFMPGIDFDQVTNELLNRGFLSANIESEAREQYRFHQKFQKMFNVVALSNRGKGSKYPVAKAFSDRAVPVIQCFLQKFSKAFHFDKYYQVHDEYDFGRFLELLPHAEKMVAFAVNLQFRHFNYGKVMTGSGDNISEAKIAGASDYLKAIKSHLGNDSILAIIQVFHELAAYYLYKQQSYWKAHAFAHQALNLLSGCDGKDSFEFIFMKAKLLTVCAGVYDCRNERRRSVDKAEEAVTCFDLLEEKFLGNCESDKYKIAKAVACGSAACSHLHMYDACGDDKDLKSAEILLKQAIKIKKAVFGPQTYTIFLNLDKLAKISLIKAKSTGDYSIAQKKLEDLLGFDGRSPWDALMVAQSLAELYYEIGEKEEAVVVLEDALAEVSLADGKLYSVDNVLSASLPIDPRVIEALLKFATIFYSNGEDKKGDAHVERAIKIYMRYFDMISPRRPLSEKEFNHEDWVFSDFYRRILSPLSKQKLYDPLLRAVDIFFNNLKEFKNLDRGFKEGLTYAKKSTVVIGSNTLVGSQLVSKLQKRHGRKNRRSNVPERLVSGLDIKGVVDPNKLKKLLDDGPAGAEELRALLESEGFEELEAQQPGLIAKLADPELTASERIAALSAAKILPLPGSCKFVQLVEDLARGRAISEIIYCGPDHAGLLLPMYPEVVIPGLERLMHFVDQRALFLCTAHVKGKFEQNKIALLAKLPKLDVCLAVHPRAERDTGLASVPASPSRLCAGRRGRLGSSSTRGRQATATSRASNPGAVVNFLMHVVAIDRSIEWGMEDTVRRRRYSPVEEAAYELEYRKDLDKDDRACAGLQLSVKKVWDMSRPFDLAALNEYGRDYAGLSACKLPAQPGVRPPIKRFTVPSINRSSLTSGAGAFFRSRRVTSLSGLDDPAEKQAAQPGCSLALPCVI